MIGKLVHMVCEIFEQSDTLLNVFNQFHMQEQTGQETSYIYVYAWSVDNKMISIKNYSLENQEDQYNLNHEDPKN